MKSKIIILIVTLLVIYIAVEKVDNNSEPSKLQKAEPINRVMVLDVDKENGNSRLRDEKLIEIARLISPLSDKDIEKNWENEYGCVKTASCYGLLNAKSFEEAIWMKRKGYLSQSVIDQLDFLPIKDLANLANRGNVNAKKLMAINAFRNSNIKHAKAYATSARAHETNGETFSLRLTAQAYVLQKNPMLATIDLRMASILGDSEATLEYEHITQNSARSFIDHVNTLAYNFLSAKLKTPINNWNNDPRPLGGGGG